MLRLILMERFWVKRFLLLFPSFLFACTLNFPERRAVETGPASPAAKVVYTRLALVADSHNENDNLKKALTLAKEKEADYIIGLGDYTQTGTTEELEAAKEVFDASGLLYFVLPGDHDLWDSRNQGQEPIANFMEVFGVVIEPSLETSFDFGYKGVFHLMIDNSDVYQGLSENDWTWLREALKAQDASPSTPDRSLPMFGFLHQPLDHPYLDHLMGRASEEVDSQRKRLLELIAQAKVDEVFAGDVHQFNRFTQLATGVKMTTVGALAATRNPESPSFVLVTVFSDGSYKVEKVEIE
jgi:3',5'-cyclic AMP phosphodiesterase CpdA